MSAAARLEPTAEPLIPQVEANPALIVLQPAKFPALLAEMRAEIMAHQPDLSTDKGRKAIASLAFKVTRTKTAIDDAGKKLNEEARAQINAVDKIRKDVRERLTDLAAEVRRPLTEWEEAEAARAERAKGIMDELRGATTIPLGATAEMVRDRLSEVEREEITEALFAESYPIAVALKAQAIEALKAGIVRIEHEEAERAELERLRKEAADREAQAKAEADERARQEREAQRVAEQKAREEAAARAAEDRARREAEEKAAEAQREQERRHQEALAAERRRVDAAEAERQAALRQQEQDRIAAEKRAANERHVAKVMGAAKAALMKHGEIDEDAAKRIVLAIKANAIPSVSITF